MTVITTALVTLFACLMVGIAIMINRFLKEKLQWGELLKLSGKIAIKLGTLAVEQKELALKAEKEKLNLDK